MKKVLVFALVFVAGVVAAKMFPQFIPKLPGMA